MAARVNAAEQRAEKRWWRERALAFEEVLEGWRHAAMLEQWPVQWRQGRPCLQRLQQRTCCIVLSLWSTTTVSQISSWKMWINSF